MKDRYVVDTNVLIAASASDPIAPTDIDATPDDPHYRLQVWHWLDAFNQSDSKMVLDTTQSIYDEYNNKLHFNDFGIQVVMNKWSTGAVENVQIEFDQDGHGVLPAELMPTIHDLADRKMVAAALQIQERHQESIVAFAGDTDWHEWEDELIKYGIDLKPIIEEWSRAKFLEKQQRKNKP